jgi:hypothetical protein
MQKLVPASYGQASYHAEHAFLFIAADVTGRSAAIAVCPMRGSLSLA